MSDDRFRGVMRRSAPQHPEHLYATASASSPFSGAGRCFSASGPWVPLYGP